MDHKRFVGVSKTRQGTISCAFYVQPYTMDFIIVLSIRTVICLTGEASAASVAGKSVSSVCEPPATYNNCQRHSRP
jgi:hypothetical protein